MKGEITGQSRDIQAAERCFTPSSGEATKGLPITPTKYYLQAINYSVANYLDYVEK